MTDSRYYIWLVCCFIVALVSYDFGYMNAQEKYQTNTKYRCYEEVVYKWTGAYWDKMGTACKTDAQMKEKNT
jgi:hypothetical protein